MDYNNMDQKKLLLDQVLKAYTFNGLSDHGTIIGREEALNSKGTGGRKK